MGATIARKKLTSISDVLHESESAGSQRRLPTSQVRSTAIGARSGRQYSGVAGEAWVDIARHSTARSGQKRVGRACCVEGARARKGTALSEGAGGGHDLRPIASSSVVVSRSVSQRYSIISCKRTYSHCLRLCSQQDLGRGIIDVGLALRLLSLLARRPRGRQWPRMRG